MELPSTGCWDSRTLEKCKAPVTQAVLRAPAERVRLSSSPISQQAAAALPGAAASSGTPELLPDNTYDLPGRLWIGLRCHSYHRGLQTALQTTICSQPECQNRIPEHYGKQRPFGSLVLSKHRVQKPGAKGRTLSAIVHTHDTHRAFLKGPAELQRSPAAWQDSPSLTRYRA